MSTLDRYDTSILTPRLSDATVKQILKYVVWDLFDLERNSSIPIRLKIFGISISKSISVSQLEPFIKLLVGDRPS